MKKAIQIIGLLFSLLLANSVALASESHYFAAKLDLDASNKASLQRGAKIYANFCAGCHSLSYESYRRVARIAGITNAKNQVYADLVQKYLIFDENANIGQMMTSSMPSESAQQWFGIAPPDLTNITLIHSPTWVYNFLRSFYPDTSRPFGTNNLIAPNTSMPNILLPLRGEAIPVYNHGHFDHFRTMQSGMLTPLDFDRAMYDLVNFLAAIAEPEKHSHQVLGIGVISFLTLLLLILYLWYRTLNHE